jgi:hypothetical protein
VGMWAGTVVEVHGYCRTLGGVVVLLAFSNPTVHGTRSIQNPDKKTVI